MRLGEGMVKEGLITNEQLAKALERQIIFGGRLGTNLVEMGAVPEETLARYLSKALGVPYAEPEKFKDVPQEVRDALPLEIAEKYTAFPIAKERNRLHLAMKDPNDIAALEDLRFIVGLDIRPYIASEIRIFYALEKYYGIKRDLRYVSLLEEEKTWDSQTAPRVMDAPITEERVDETGPDEHDAPQPQVTAPVVERPAASAAQAAPRHAPPQPAPPVVERPAASAAHAAPRPAPPQPAPPQPVQRKVAPPSVDPYEMLASPVDREYIAGAVVAAASRELKRAALFLVKGGVLTGWRAAGVGLSDEMVASARVVLDAPSIFKEVVEDKASYKGPLLKVPQNNQFMDAVGGVYPAEAVALPLIIKGKVVGVLYGDNGKDALIGGDIERLKGLMVKASMSLEILILKSKILGG